MPQEKLNRMTSLKTQGLKKNRKDKSQKSMTKRGDSEEEGDSEEKMAVLLKTRNQLLVDLVTHLDEVESARFESESEGELEGTKKPTELPTEPMKYIRGAQENKLPGFGKAPRQNKAGCNTGPIGNIGENPFVSKLAAKNERIILLYEASDSARYCIKGDIDGNTGG